MSVCQSFVSVYLCPRGDDTAAYFSRSLGGGGVKGGIRSLFSASVAGTRDEPLRTSAWETTGDVALCFFRGLFFVKAGRYVIKDGFISLQRIFQ